MACRAIPGVERSGDRSITFTLPTMFEAIRCFKAVSTMAAASSERDYG
jgi:D-amino peptidase